MKVGLILLALVVAGCKVDIGENPPAKPATPAASTTGATTTATTGSAASTTASTTGTASSKPEAGSTTGTSTPAKPGENPKGTSTSTTEPSKNETSSTTPEEQKPGFNRDRIYQLADLKTVQLTINGQKLRAWVADIDSVRNEGLMFVKDKDIASDQGMLFVFPFASTQGFWMKRTYIPLEIAFIGADKTVVSTATMKPFDETNTPSKGPAQYALEMKVGTLGRLGITKGTKIPIPADIKAQDTPTGGGPGMGGFPGGGLGGPPPGG